MSVVRSPIPPSLRLPHYRTKYDGYGSSGIHVPPDVPQLLYPCLSPSVLSTSVDMAVHRRPRAPVGRCPPPRAPPRRC